MTKKALIVRYAKRHFIFKSILLLMFFLTTRCIEEYDPNLHVDVNLLTVNASIVRGHEEQRVVLTRSTPIDDTEYIAVENCNVFVTDDRDNTFQFEERSAGQYVAKIDGSYLNTGARFKLTIITPDRKRYESDYEEIQDCPPVDNLYFNEETSYSKELHHDINGLRLYLNLPALEGYTRYYRWKINETWEYRSQNKFIDAELVGADSRMIVDTIDDIIEIFYVPVPILFWYNKPDSLHYCWNHRDIRELYSTSTADLITNGRKQLPFHHVSEYDERLMHRYSCLVSQYSLNEGAYHYWHSKKVEFQESGGIYFSQPSQTASNIRNINNDQETILGYFWTSTVKQKRIFYEGPFILDALPGPCETEIISLYDYIGEDISDPSKFVLTNKSAFPLYLEARIVRRFNPFTLVFYWDTLYSTTDRPCFDCRLKGGTILRPEYW